MLRQVFIVKDGEKLYERRYGKALDEKGFVNMFEIISEGAFRETKEKIETNDFFKYRITHILVPEDRLFFIFVTSVGDKPSDVKRELKRLKKEFMQQFGMILGEEVDQETFEIFDPTVDSIHKNLRPKISLVGFSGVGKTTITRLIKADEIPTEHVPTITGDIATIKIGKLHFHLWDFAGQEQFSYLWDNFVKGSDAILLITDSTLDNVEKSKFFTELIAKQAPYARCAAIGNKQDLPGTLSVKDIERHLGIKTYSMVATDPDNRDKMIQIVADILEMSAEISPLLQPLLNRDEKVAKAENALKEGNYIEAIKFYEEVADLCIDLGDDNLSAMFHEQADTLRAAVKKALGEEALEELDAISEEEDEEELVVKAPQVEAQPVAPTISAPTGLKKPPPPPGAPKAETVETILPSKKPVVEQPEEVSEPVKSGPGSMDALSSILKNIKQGSSSKPPAPSKTPPAPPKPANKPPKATFKTTQYKGPLMEEPAVLHDNSPPSPKPPSSQSPPQSSSVESSPSSKPPAAAPSQNLDKTTIKNKITNIKLKVMDLDNVLLDLELENISGELTDEEFTAKEERLVKMKTKLIEQKQELEQLLNE